jgi:DNA-binding XRE family transcriptional regulator
MNNANQNHVAEQFVPATNRKHVVLARLRKHLHVTQGQFAEWCGCSPFTVQSIEVGRLALSKRLAERIGLITGAPIDWLLENKLDSPIPSLAVDGVPLQKTVTKNSNTKQSAEHPLTGLYFLSYQANGTCLWQGFVRQVIEDDILLVQLFSWFDGRQTHMQLVPIAETISRNGTKSWVFYSDHEIWIEAGNRAFDAEKAKVRENSSIES